MNVPAFPTLSPAQRERMLEPPTGPVRLLIDTDAANEIDDQFAIAWALLSPEAFELEGTLIEPYSFAHHREPLLAAFDELQQGGTGDDGPAVEAIVGSYRRWAQNLVAAGTDPRDVPFVLPAEGMELSYHEARKVYELLGHDPEGKVFRGSAGYLPAPAEPLPSESAEVLIERAMADDDRPLYVAAIGAVTNIASAILIEPRIIERIVVVWTSSYPSWSPLSSRPSLNLVQDLPASRLLFDSGVPLVYLPGFYIGEQLSISLPEMERWVQGRGRIGDYLYHLYTHNPIHAQRGITDREQRTWVIWDLICFAWLMRPTWVPSRLAPSPVLDDDLLWQHPPGRHLMREAVGIDRDEVFCDFYRKLEEAP
jgi:inosine-uridine nucleoside N-ribohydrolase